MPNSNWFFKVFLKTRNVSYDTLFCIDVFFGYVFCSFILSKRIILQHIKRVKPDLENVNFMARDILIERILEIDSC